MGKITIDPTTLRKNQPGGEHITRIMYDDNEPPKNYIWGKPDGFLYVWNGVEWVLLNSTGKPLPSDFPPGPPPSGSNNSQGISKKDLEIKLKLLKSEIINYLTKLINAKDCNDGDGANAIRWFRNEILPEINRLRGLIESFATKTELAEVRQELLDLIDGLSSSEIVTELIRRIEILEAFPHDRYVTKDELLQALSEVASSETIININNAITNINNEIINIKSDIENNNLVVSAALNDLNDRVYNLETNPSVVGDFVTAEEVTDISSIQL